MLAFEKHSDGRPDLYLGDIDLRQLHFNVLPKVIAPSARVLGKHRASTPQSSSASRFTAAHAGFFMFEPVGRAPRTVRRVLALRHNTLEPILAGVGEDRRAIALDMLVEPNAGAGLGHDRCERGLADLEWVTA